MNKLASMLAIVILCSTITFGSTEPQFSEGESCFVMAHSGLSLRSDAGSHYEVLTIIPFGEVVQILRSDSTMVSDQINWVSGHWVPVYYDGYTGYVFDGYLSALSLPIHEFEKSQSEMDFIYPLESWINVHLHSVGSVDTITTDYYEQVTHHFESGDKLTVMNAGNLYKLKLSMKDIRIMDAYHLLKSMLNDKYEIEQFEKSTLFLASEANELTRIKIGLDNPVDIRLEKNGHVLITLTSQDYECQ